MATYEPNIDEWIYLIKGNHLEHCREQELAIDNVLLPVLNRPDVYIDEERIAKGLSLQKYFSYDLLPWEKYQFAVIAGVFLRMPGAEYDDIYFHEIRDIMGRGSGKNGFIDFLALYFISPFHGVKGYNVDLIANGEEQAATSIRDVYDLIENPVNPKLRRALDQNFKATVSQITGKKTQSVFRLNTSSTKNKDSKRTGCIIFDEKHMYESSTNMNTLRSGLGKMRWSREITITTDGNVRGGILDQEKAQNEIILHEYNQKNRVFVNWFRIETENEWKDIHKIVKAVPSIADPSFYNLKLQIEQEIEKMPTTPEYFPEFLAKRCNYPISDPAKAVAEWKDIEACCNPAPFEIVPTMSCVGGVDYTKTNDFVGCILLFRRGQDFQIIHHSFICAKSRDLPNIHAPIEKWAEQGICTIVNDVEVPAEMIASWFHDKAKIYNIEYIGIDDYRFSLLNAAFKKIGFDAFDKNDKNIWLTRRSDIMKAAPIINSMFVNHHLYGFDRMMCWYTNNAKQIVNSDGNITYGKQDPRLRKTDGFMALVHASCCIEHLPDVPELPDIDMSVHTY